MFILKAMSHSKGGWVGRGLDIFVLEVGKGDGELQGGQELWHGPHSRSVHSQHAREVDR